MELIQQAAGAQLKFRKVCPSATEVEKPKESLPDVHFLIAYLYSIFQMKTELSH